MKKEFIDYLESIGITSALQERIETIHEAYAQICTDEIKDIFVTDYIKGDGEREYVNLWFFSDNNCMEAKNFISADDLDITPLKGIFYVRLLKTDYDFKKASEKSRLSVTCLFGETTDSISGEFKASKENCDYLRNLIRKYLVSQLRI